MEIYAVMGGVKIRAEMVFGFQHRVYIASLMLKLSEDWSANGGIETRSNYEDSVVGSLYL